MKKLAIILCGILCPLLVLGQNTFYSSRTEIETEFGKYKCLTNNMGIIHLFKADNIYADDSTVNKNQFYKFTGEPFKWRDEVLVKYDSWIEPLLYKIVREAFTHEQLNLLQDEEMGVKLYIETFAGRIFGVEFVFHETSYYNKIPISVYSKIEDKIKSKVWFKRTSLGMQLNYVTVYWQQNPSIE